MAEFSSAIPYIKKAEGGLSRATTDSASKNPAPWPYNGKSGWHTNKGITYTTFASLTPKLGYGITADNFFVMPDSIWLKIYKYGYWDPMKTDSLNSQALANAIVDYAWAFGVGGAAARIKKYLKNEYGIQADTMSHANAAFNELIKRHGEQQVFLDFIDHRKKAFQALNQPANEKGWLNRMEELKNQGLQLLTNNPIAAGGSGLIGLILFFLLVKKLKNKKKKK